MRTLSQLSESFELLSWMASALLIAWIGYRIYSIGIRRSRRNWVWKMEGHWYLKTLKILTGITMIVVLISTPVVLLVLSPSARFVSQSTTIVLFIATMIGALLELGLSLSISKRLKKYGWKKVFATLFLIAVGNIFFPFLLSLPDYLANPSLEQAYEMELPIEGTWTAGHAGASTKVNYHNAHPSQKYAIDIVKVDERGLFFQRKGSEMEDFFTFKARVFAPVSGMIVNAVNHLPNHPVSLAPNDSINPAGNHVVIEFDQGRYVFLAHLHPGSLSVSEGDFVQAGDLIGLAGNSGNTSWPHVHMHIQDSPVLDDKATAYPFYFRQLSHKRWFWWHETEREFLLRNDLFRPNF